MKVGGWTTKPTVLVDSSMLMEMSMMDNGLMIRHMDMVFTAILTQQDTRVNGRRISNMVWVLRHGQMVLNSVDNTSKERSMVKEPSHGLMDQPTLVNLSRTT